MTQTISRGRIIRRAGSLFVFTLVWASSINIIPQLYLLTFYPERKSFLLSWVLVIGTLGAILGIGMSRRNLTRQRPLARRDLLLATLGYLLPFALLIFEVKISSPICSQCSCFD